MRIALISCFETYKNRMGDMERYYTSNHHDVTVIKSNFLHFKKEYIVEETQRKNVELIKVPSYKKNISVKRIISHFTFSNRTFEYLEKNNFDLIHVLIPPNSLCKKISKLSNSPKVIYDVIDLWPETMPIRNISRLSLYRRWQSMRNLNIDKSDIIIAECKLFESELKKQVKNIDINTIYFSRELSINKISFENKMDVLELVYLGSINNLIDINKIIILLENINKVRKVIFNIVGDGEKKVYLISLLKENNIEYIDHGVVYDEKKKEKIFSKCAFGLNIMKKNVFVGLTMKSLDYFQYGLPLINNIGHDTTSLVSKYSIGININEYSSIENLVKKIITLSQYDENILLRNNVINMVEKEFTYDVFKRKMDLIVDSL